MNLGFFTLGCKLNQSETEAFARSFQEKGFFVFNLNTQKPKDSLNFIIINSCAVTEQASLKSLKKIKILKNLYPISKIIFLGCLAIIDEERIKKWGADFVLKDKEALFSFIRHFKENSNILKISDLPFYFHTRYFLKIQEGCSNFCTYCIIPYTRGFEEKSRKPEEILKEIKETDPKEVVLCGVNIGHFKVEENKKTFDLKDLIKEIAQKTPVKRIRISSINPEDVEDKFIKIMKRYPQVAPHLHLSLQSGSDEVLKRMNRRYKVSEFRNLIKKLKEEIPEITLTADVIVGFPGETEKDFENTCRLVSDIGFLKVHIFPYSPRPKTPAFLMPNQLSRKIIKQRAKILREIQKKAIQKVKRNYLLGEFEVLFEERKERFFSGFTSNYLKVYTEDVNLEKDLKGQFKKVKLEKVFKDGFLGKIK